MGKRRGFGTIRKMRSGRYQAEYTGPDLQRHRAADTFTAKAHAEGWLASQRKAIDAGTWRTPAEVAAASYTTLTQFAEAWVEARELKPRTRVEYRRLVAATIATSPIGDLPVDAITTTAVRMWHGSLNKSTPTRKAHAYQLLRAIMTTVVEDGTLPTNPCRIPRAGSTTRVREITVPTEEELEVIVEATPERYRAMVLLAAWCGLRFGELTPLRRGDIDGAVVHVQRGAVRAEGETIIGDPKSDAGIRQVHIPPHVLPEIERHLRSIVTGRNGLLFPTPTGRVMIGGDQLNDWWHAARAAAGREDLRFHDLRHLGATAAGRVGATIPELMQRLGHSTPNAAMRYQHAAAGRDAEIARRLSAAAAGG